MEQRSNARKQYIAYVAWSTKNTQDQEKRSRNKKKITQQVAFQSSIPSMPLLGPAMPAIFFIGLCPSCHSHCWKLPFSFSHPNVHSLQHFFCIWIIGQSFHTLQDELIYVGIITRGAAQNIPSMESMLISVVWSAFFVVIFLVWLYGFGRHGTPLHCRLS